MKKTVDLWAFFEGFDEEKGMADKIIYKNGRQYSMEAYQKILGILSKGREVSAQSRKSALSLAKIIRNLSWYLKGDGKEVFKQPVPLKVALKYGYKKGKGYPTWRSLLETELGIKALKNQSIAAMEMILRIENNFLRERKVNELIRRILKNNVEYEKVGNNYV